MSLKKIFFSGKDPRYIDAIWDIFATTSTVNGVLVLTRFPSEPETLGCPIMLGARPHQMIHQATFVHSFDCRPTRGGTKRC